VVEFFGVTSTLAPPADQVGFYSRFQLWFAIAIGLLSAVGQFFWWKKIDRKQLFSELYNPVLVSLVLVAIIITAGKVYKPGYILLTLAGVFTVVANSKILWSVFKNNPALSGGAVAHIGVGLMLIGIMFSSGYSTVVSLNNTGMLISRQLSEEFNRENLLLFVNEPREMFGYEIEYKGERVQPRKKAGYISKRDIEYTADPYTVIARRDIVFNESKLYTKGEQFEISPENTFYEIEFRKNGKVKFVQYPRVQANPRFGNMASPDINRKVSMDLYTHVSAPMPEEAKEDWTDREEITVKRNSEFFANDYVARIDELFRVTEISGTPLDSTFVAVRARIRVQAEHTEYTAEPVLILSTAMQGGLIPEEIPEVGLKFTLLNVLPRTDELILRVESRQKDWVVIKALEKPFVNVLWIGTVLLMTGFGIAMARRFSEFKKMKEKGLE
jgi:cytochrome c-type biogenesis protein CcmF